MRIEQETRHLYVRGQQEVQQKSAAEVEENLKKGRVFSGKVQFPQDKVAERRRAAQEKALNIVKSAFTGELAVDDSIDEMNDSIEKAREEMISQKAELNRIAERKENLKGRSDLTAEEYEQELAQLNEAEKHFSGLLADGKKLEERTIQALTDIKLERAKSHPMVDASKEAEKALAAGGKEVVSLLFEEAKEHIDTETEEKREAAEEKAAKEKELEERIEAMKAKKEEKEESAATETEFLEAATRQMVKIAETGEIVQKELKNIVDQYKLDLADLKGAAVDEGV